MADHLAYTLLMLKIPFLKKLNRRKTVSLVRLTGLISSGSRGGISDSALGSTLDKAFKNSERLICFAVKAKPNIAILNILANLGAGFDIVSGGELKRVIAAKGDTKKVVFSGIGKSVDEIKSALERDNFMTAETAKSFGLIDEVVEKRS